jgi:hypothetical protein
VFWVLKLKRSLFAKVENFNEPEALLDGLLAKPLTVCLTAN